MVKHNQAVPNAHFHKDWKSMIKTWFNQPARKHRRRQARAEKAARVFPRPVSGLLRPEVQCPTVRYQLRSREGRGFTPDELKVVGIPLPEARGIGIAVDRRRKNRSQEAFDRNVQRLKAYQSRLMILPRSRAPELAAKKIEQGKTVKSRTKHTKKTETMYKDFDGKNIVTTGPIVPLSKPSTEVVFRKISDDEKKKSAYAILRRSRGLERGVGRAGKIKEKEAPGAKPAAAKGGRR